MQTTSSGFIERRFAVIFWPLLLTFLGFGFSMTIIGAILPRILQEFRWSYTSAGLVLAANAGGYLVSTVLAGMLVARSSPKAVLVGGLLLMTLSLALFGRTSSVLYNLLFNLLIGVGQGCVELVVNYSMVRMERAEQSHLMSFVHASFSVGAIFGPALVAYILARGIAWQFVYLLAAAVSAALAILMAFLPFSRLGASSASGARYHISTVLRYPLMWLTVGALFIYVGFELGISNWVSEYFVRIFHSAASASAFMVSGFWLGIFIGRIGVPIIYRGSKQSRVLIVLTFVCVISLIAALLVRAPIPAALCFFAVSLGCSAVYPLVMTLIGRYFKEGQSVAVGLASGGGGAGSLLFPLLMAGVAQADGLRAGFTVYVVMGIVLSVVSFFINAQIHRRAAA